jgi:DcaP outer membrane protein
MTRMMTPDERTVPPLRVRPWLLAAALLLGPLAHAQSPEATPMPEAAAPAASAAEPAEDPGPKVELYGFAMLDVGYDFGQNDPAWFDVVRPTKLPSFEDEFGTDGRYFAGVRQSRFGVRTYLPTDLGELKTIFEFELFGTGVDAGQTTFRLRHAWGELGFIGAGQTWSPFMDPDVFPNSIEYWGPSGMVFFRNVQLRITPWQTEKGSRIAIAFERPGSSQDLTNYEERLELRDVSARFPAPDISGQVRLASDLGHVQLAGILRRINWDDRGADVFDLTGGTWGWGVNLSGNLKFLGQTLRLQGVYGEAIQNYMNDAPVDIAVEPQADPLAPLTGEPIPVLGLVAFLDLNWTKQFSSSIGYSLIDMDNTPSQAPASFSRGHYALANILFSPVANLMLGPEVQFGRRENFTDGFSVDTWRIQFSAKYSFKTTFGGQ